MATKVQKNYKMQKLLSLLSLFIDDFFVPLHALILTKTPK